MIIVSPSRARPRGYKLVEELAAALGGMAGASPIVDDGQVGSIAPGVGLTGRITRPALYLAAGISGASRHMAGCSAAKTIAAINTDKDAAIFHHPLRRGGRSRRDPGRAHQGRERRVNR
ncbi:MAG: FAD-binding protein [bacterium]